MCVFGDLTTSKKRARLVINAISAGSRFPHGATPKSRRSAQIAGKYPIKTITHNLTVFDHGLGFAKN